jgi:ubiquinone biosynthesis protein UbiJ
MSQEATTVLVEVILLLYQETSELRKKVETLEYRLDQLEQSRP